jgi:hypothetical protein
MRRLVARRIGPLVALALAGAAPAGAQVTLGQIDTFTSGAEGWFFGGGPGGIPITPAAVDPSGGPGGAGDAFMHLNATGSAGPGSRLSILNAAHWGGNYLAAGVGAIRMDVQNPSASDLFLRIFVEALGAMGPTDIAVTRAVFVPAGSDWMTVFFPLLPGSLANVPIPGGSVTGALTNATLIRLAHSPTGGEPPPVDAELFVDNVAALGTIPEPSTVVLVTSGVLALAALRRRTARRG